MPRPDSATATSSGPGRWPRRSVLQLVTALGAGAVFGRALVSCASGKTAVTASMIREAEWISGLSLTPGERELMLDGVNELLEDFAKVRAVPLDNAVPPALQFQPLSSAPGEPARAPRMIDLGVVEEPAPRGSDDELAFASVMRLAALIRSRQLSSAELTRLYLDRLKRHGPQLECVISLTEELALEQAARADQALARGEYLGPLHGIPWGAKDLLAVSGYRTTWGAKPYEDQVLSETSTVAARLEDSGGVLLAKLTLGALAWGDVWYGGRTRNPWDSEQGSSGSSAGSAAATAAGLVGFAIGSETWGSIVSPATRCGVSGLRPTFGRVSRHGAMALAWSMDKLGPLARSVDDCALVFAAIHGADGLDPTAIDRDFRWPDPRDPRSLRVGYVRALFEEDRTANLEDEDVRRRAAQWQDNDRRTLDVLREIGFDLVPIRLPEEPPVAPLSFILTAEAATAFDGLTRGGRDDLLVRQIEQAWPNVFRQGQLIPAVEYIRANRIRTLLGRRMEQVMADVDLYVCPSYGGDNLLLTNLTGHPCVVLPNGFADGTPTSITFNGRLYGETEILAVARAYQQATDHHLRRPPSFSA